MPHLYKIALGIVGAAVLFIFTPAPHPQAIEVCSGPYIREIQDTCTQNSVAKMVGLLVGLVGGVIVGAIADNAMSKKSQSDGQANNAPQSQTGSVPQKDTVTLLQELNSLRIAGIISEEEFEKKKAQILNRI